MINDMPLGPRGIFSSLKMADADYQLKIAKGIADGIDEFFCEIGESEEGKHGRVKK